MTDRTFANLKNIKPFFGKRRTLTTTIYKPEADGKSTWLIPKSKDPGPGSYKVEEAEKKTRPHVHGSLKNNDKKVCFFDEMKKRKMFVPGAGKYDADDKVKHKIHRDP